MFHVQVFKTKKPPLSFPHIKRRHNSNYSIKIPSSTQSSSWERSAKLVKNIDRTNQYLEHIRDVHDPSQHLKTLEDELRGTMGKALGKQGQKVLSALKKLQVERERYEHLIYSIVSENGGEKSEIDEENHQKNSHQSTSKNNNNSPQEQQKQNRLTSTLQKLSFQSISSSNQTKLLQIIHQYNRHKKDAEKARWELTVHRQAVGFIVNNHRFVQEKFPIPSQLPLPHDMDDSMISSNNNHGHHNDGCRNGMNKGRGGDGGVIRNFGDQLDWWEKIGRWR